MGYDLNVITSVFWGESYEAPFFDLIIFLETQYTNIPHTAFCHYVCLQNINGKILGSRHLLIKLSRYMQETKVRTKRVQFLLFFCLMKTAKQKHPKFINSLNIIFFVSSHGRYMWNRKYESEIFINKKGQ